MTRRLRVLRHRGSPGSSSAWSSPTARRAGAGGHPCQGLYYRGVGRKPKVGDDRHALPDRLLRALPRGLHGHPRHRLPRAGTPGSAASRAASCSTTHWSTSASVCAGCARCRASKPLCCLGNSGGGSLMAAYQAQARGPPRHPAGRDAPRGRTHRPARRRRLHRQRGTSRVGPTCSPPGWTPSVTDENDAVATDPALDLFDSDNGPPYSAEFVERYRVGAGRAQRRDHRLGRGRTQTRPRGRLLRPARSP